MLPIILAALVASAISAATPPLAEPGISPDGREIAFVSGGDIWTVPAAGGVARLLVSHSATESRPLYSPDGKRLAFQSNRSGGTNIFILTLATGEIKRITFNDGSDNLSAWSADGKWLYFHASYHDIGGTNDVFRVGSEGGTPAAVTAEKYVNEFQGAPSPTGDALVFAARGGSSVQWWRNGSSHLDQSELWVLRNAKYEKLVDRGARNNWPMWSSDGRTVYFMSDRSGAQNIWRKPLAGAAAQITKFRDGRVLWPSISRDGTVIVFERDMHIWRLDVRTGQAAAVPIELRGAPAMPASTHLSLTTGFSDLALSPDGKKIAFIARGDVFAASAKDGGDARRITSIAAPESRISWAPNSKGIAYLSARDSVAHLYSFDFVKGVETQLTRDTLSDTQAVYSPDGKSLAFIRGGKELRVMDVNSKLDHAIATGTLERSGPFQQRAIAWSPDSKWIAYLASGEKLFHNLRVVPAAGGQDKQVSFLPNSSIGSFAWSPDGHFLLFTSGQRTEPDKTFRIDWTPHRPPFREETFDKLFDDEKKPTPAPTEIVFDGIKRRIRTLAPALDASSVSISPDGKNALILASTGGMQNLYLYSLDENAKEAPAPRQLTSTSTGKRNPQFTPDSKEVFYLENGRIQVTNIETRAARTVNVTAEMDSDPRALSLAAFDQAWSNIRDFFYDDKFHGVDWNAMRERYRPAAEASLNDDDLRRVLNLMVGELNASHSGASAGPAGQTPVVGRLGLRTDDALRVLEIVPLGPAALSGKIKAGDTILSVDGAPIVNLDERLENKIGKRVMISVRHAAGATEVVPLRPIALTAERQLVYDHWVDSRRDYVERVSNGKLAYVHMPDMSDTSLSRLYLDLDEDAHAKKGVVIDIRNNNGGFVNAYALDVFSRRHYLNMTPRGASTAPARSQLGQRAIELPSVLVVNQHSLSDAEDFTEGYRAMKLGKIVGEPTAGWIIYTSGVTLVDGTSFRLPFVRITTASGENMERNPRPVDIPVSNPLGAQNDAQLDAAVKELLSSIPAAR